MSKEFEVPLVVVVENYFKQAVFCWVLILCIFIISSEQYHHSHPMTEFLIRPSVTVTVVYSKFILLAQV